MAIQPKISVQSADFNIGAETELLTAQSKNIGAIVSFTGLCRDESGRLSALELEHYPGMAESKLAEIAQEATARWILSGLTIIHRFGKIEPGANIVMVIAASTHRRAAFEAADFLMDFLKTDAPFWKKEHLVDGHSGDWVEAKDSDEADKTRWQTD
ncbi:MAG: molybdenum cofactor biosynthesis protein MoaE [Pseudomonadota bacterium]